MDMHDAVARISAEDWGQASGRWPPLPAILDGLQRPALLLRHGRTQREILQVNRRFSAETGVTQAELVGTSVAQWFDLPDTATDGVMLPRVLDRRLRGLEGPVDYRPLGGPADPGWALMMFQCRDVPEPMAAPIPGGCASIADHAQSAAHDIKALLASVDAQLDVDLDEAGLKRALRCLARARRIADDLLYVGRSRPLDLQEIDLRELLDRARETAAPMLHPALDLALRVPTDAVLATTDETLLLRALVNLVLNAARAMPKGGTITLALEPEGDGRWTVAVIDQGEGIARDDHARIFTPHVSLSGSHGLGLAVVCEAAAQLDLRLEAVSRPGRGTSIRITFPGPDRAAVCQGGSR